MNWQVLRDWFNQAWSDRRLKAEGCNERRGWSDHEIQAWQPDDVCVGNTRPSVGWRSLYQRHCTQCQLHQQVLVSSLIDVQVYQLKGATLRTLFSDTVRTVGYSI